MIYWIYCKANGRNVSRNIMKVDLDEIKTPEELLEKVTCKDKRSWGKIWWHGNREELKKLRDRLNLVIPDGFALRGQGLGEL